MRSLLYRLASFLGDLNALQRGPDAILRRVARKAAQRTIGGLLNRLF